MSGMGLCLKLEYRLPLVLASAAGTADAGDVAAAADWVGAMACKRGGT